MPRIRAFRLSHIATGACRRLGVWLGVVALVLQLLVPLAQPQAAWAEDGLFPPTCSIHLDFGAADQSDGMDCGECALCQAHFAEVLGRAPDRVVTTAYEAAAEPMKVAPSHATVPSGVSARPPLPSRGPPAAA